MQSVLDRIRSTVELPTIPTTLVRIMEVVESETSTAEDLAQVVSKDHALAAKILRVANSALYAMPRKVEDINRAVTLMGFYQVRDVALSMSVFDSLWTPTPSGARFDRARFWQHCFIVAYATREIARRCGELTGLAFTAGLLHDVGKVVVDLKIPKLWLRIVDNVIESGKGFREVEQSMLGTSHDEIGAMLLDIWQLPSDLIDATAGHHEPLEQENPIAALTFCADRVAHAAGFGSMDQEPECVIEEFLESEKVQALEAAGKMPDAVIVQEVYNEIVENSEYLSAYSAGFF